MGASLLVVVTDQSKYGISRRARRRLTYMGMWRRSWAYVLLQTEKEQCRAVTTKLCAYGNFLQGYHCRTHNCMKFHLINLTEGILYQWQHPSRSCTTDFAPQKTQICDSDNNFRRHKMK